MQSDWTVACGADDPTVAVPWFGCSRSDKDESIRYVDLRDDLSRVGSIPEAVTYPSVAAALHRWNQPDSPLFTAKCDVWEYPSNLFDAEDFPGFACAQASYIDLLTRDLEIFSSFSACERMLRDWTECARSIALPDSRCEWMLRPARVLTAATGEPHPGESDPGWPQREGYATTLYVWGYGASSTLATAAWSRALRALVEPVLHIG